MAPAEVVVEVRPQPPPPPAALAGLLDLAVVKPLLYLYLASLWVACAGLAAAAVARRACGEGSPVHSAFLKVSIGALLVTALLLVVLSLMMLRAMRAAGFRLSLSDWAKQGRKMFGAWTWELLWDATVLGSLAFCTFLLPIVAGVLVSVGLLPAQASQRERIGSALFDVGLLGVLAMCCFIIIPSLALKVWRIK